MACFLREQIQTNCLSSSYNLSSQLSRSPSDGTQAPPPSARYERGVGVSLVRAAWERRPEGPAYLLSSVMLLYLAGQCAYFSTHFPPIGSLALGGFSRVLADGSFLGFLKFKVEEDRPNYL